MHNKTEDMNTFKTFVVLISNDKNVEEKNFDTDTPILKYFQNTSNSCCFISLVPDFESINPNKAKMLYIKIIIIIYKSSWF